MDVPCHPSAFLAGLGIISLTGSWVSGLSPGASLLYLQCTGSPGQPVIAQKCCSVEGGRDRAFVRL